MQALHTVCKTEQQPDRPPSMHSPLGTRILTHPYVCAEVRLHGSPERPRRGRGGLQVRCPQQHTAGAAVVLCSAHQRLCHYPHRLLVA